MAYWCHQVLRRDRQRDKCPSEWDHAGLWPEPVQRRDSGHLNSTQKQGRRLILKLEREKIRIWWQRWIWMALVCSTFLSSWPWWAIRYMTLIKMRTAISEQRRGGVGGSFWIVSVLSKYVLIGINLTLGQGRGWECRGRNKGSLPGLWWGE